MADHHSTTTRSAPSTRTAIGFDWHDPATLACALDYMRLVLEQDEAEGKPLDRDFMVENLRYLADQVAR